MEEEDIKEILKLRRYADKKSEEKAEQLLEESRKIVQSV